MGFQEGKCGKVTGKYMGETNGSNGGQYRCISMIVKRTVLLFLYRIGGSFTDGSFLYKRELMPYF